MEYISKTYDLHIDMPSAITFGKFDGLHRGHELLMGHLKERAKEAGLVTIVFTFDVPPRVNRPDAAENDRKVLTTNGEKRLIFEEEGIDYLIEYPFTKEVMDMEADCFIRKIVKELNVREIIVGTDFHFGRNRGGDYQLLRDLEQELGYHTTVLDKMQEDKRDISSTYVREEILAGHMEKANSLLGYNYFVSGEVIHGRHLGTRIGIPTVNLMPEEDKLLPPLGVYVSRIRVGGETYCGVSNIGRKPTVGDHNPVGVETFIIDFDKDVYGRKITVELLSFLRPEMKFHSVDELRERMAADVKSAKKYFQNCIYKA